MAEYIKLLNIQEVRLLIRFIYEFESCMNFVPLKFLSYFQYMFIIKNVIHITNKDPLLIEIFLRAHESKNNYN